MGAEAKAIQKAAEPVQPERPRPPIQDGRQRIYLYVFGEDQLCMEYLDKKYEDDDYNADVITVRKTSEIRLDRLNETHIVIPVVRDINKDRRVQAIEPSPFPDQPPQRVWSEQRGKVFEGKPIDVSQFYRRAKSRDAEDTFDEEGFLLAVGAVCAPAAPRIQSRPEGPKMSNGQRNETRYLTLKWG